MPVITSIVLQKNKNRVNIYLDNKFGFGIDLENFVKAGLKTGQQLSDVTIAEITKKTENKKFLDRLLIFVNLRPRSGKEVGEWMDKKKIAGPLREELKEKIIELKLLDDEFFAKWWVEQRLSFRSKSKRELIAELRNKGISKEIIEKVMFETDVDEVSSALKLVEKHIRRWSRFPKHIVRQKMSLYLARKGFNWDTIKKAINKYEEA